MRLPLFGAQHLDAGIALYPRWRGWCYRREAYRKGFVAVKDFASEAEAIYWATEMYVQEWIAHT